jgi:hypothetical protein
VVKTETVPVMVRSAGYSGTDEVRKREEVP